jgi:hypothetical protein
VIALVSRTALFLSEHMAERVYCAGNLMQRRHPNATSPKKAARRILGGNARKSGFAQLVDHIEIGRGRRA